MRKSIAQLRQSAFDQQHGRCFYCSHSMWQQDVCTFAKSHGLTMAQAELHRATAEHLIAQCDGGPDQAGNIVAACLVCNRRRHQRRQENAPSAEAYKKRVQGRCTQGRWLPWLAKLNQTCLCAA
ncbi:HNH endonuclease [Paucibacter sp. B2R-40]|uniref:HNH endonuclease n=1 Tax=Paucibacter sp. B2R-40 TaxID=2893554 RepID=UPI00398D530D